MTTVRERMRASSNDYSALEERYRRATGAELVVDPYGSYPAGPPALTRTAAIVIGSYNSRPSLELSLISIESTMFNRRHPELLQVVVVDDGSTDGTAEMVSSLRLDLNLLYVRQERGGIAAARNTGVAFAESEVVIFADSDLVHLPYGIDELMKRHEVLDGVVLLGFRFGIDPSDHRLAAGAFRSNLWRFDPDFASDFRLSFPGRPTNMCRETGHLKQLGWGRSLLISNGGYYDLSAMVVGAFFSLEREDYEAIGGSDERFRGWGCEDSVVGAQSIALGNMVLPVYSAVAGHILHPWRDPTQAQDFQRNLRIAAAVMDEEWNPPRRFDAARFRRRTTDRREVSSAGRANGSAETPPPSYPVTAGDSRRRADRLYALGRYAEARDQYENHLRADGSYWPMLELAKTKRELRDPEACAAFEEVLRMDGRNPWGCFEGSLAFAEAGDYRRARQLLQGAAGVFEHDWTLRLGSDGHKRRGNHHARQELHAAAATDFSLALIVDANNAWAHYDRGLSLRALGRRDDARAAVESAAALMAAGDANRTWPHSVLAALHLDAGRPNRAKLELERALELNPDNGQAAEVQTRLTGETEAAAQLRMETDAYAAVESIPGWLAPDEAGLLAGAVRLSLERNPSGRLLELGSFCGKSTAVIAGAIRDSGVGARLTTVDPHDGSVPADGEPTIAQLRANLERLGLETRVDVVAGLSSAIPWTEPIGFLFVDAVHDYDGVASDFARFGPSVLPGGLIAFHDYSGHFPGVRRLVHEVLGGEEFRYVSQRGHLIVLERVAGTVTISPS